jgi:hypothetical protein
LLIGRMPGKCGSRRPHYSSLSLLNESSGCDGALG